MLCVPAAIVIDSRSPNVRQRLDPGRTEYPLCRSDGEGWSFAGAHGVALFCNGPWCGQSPAAIRGMVAAGFPATRFHCYGDSIQHWILAGLTATERIEDLGNVHGLTAAPGRGLVVACSLEGVARDEISKLAPPRRASMPPSTAAVRERRTAARTSSGWSRSSISPRERTGARTRFLRACIT